jgi:hypothetical protein
MTNKTNWCSAVYTIQNPNCGPFTIQVSGRNRWTFEKLMQAGPQGCTPIERPAPRWSGYVFDLRKLGVQIETITEPHDGPFAGSHGRYVLHSIVTRPERGEVAA